MQRTCTRCGKSWESAEIKPRTCRWCRSPYWDKPVVRQSVSDARKKQPDPGPTVEVPDAVHSVMSAYTPTALEHAAKAEAPIGRSVTDFLLNNPPRVSVDMAQDRGVFIEVTETEVVEIDGWHAQCLQDFGVKVLTTAAKSVPRWERMNWQQRHEFLKAQKEAAEW